MDGSARRIDGLHEIAPDFDAVICDLWGVLHDGAVGFPDAIDALSRFRRGGRLVAVLSNSPQRSERLRDGLAARGIDEGVYHRLITSGDLTRDYAARHHRGATFFHLGPASDRPTIEGLPLIETNTPEAADIVIATGLAVDSAADHDALLKPAAARGVPLLCANPDRIVIHAGERELCAGAVAERYEAMGGPVIWLGKPASPPYAACRRTFSALAGHPVPDGRILVIGDALVTDIAGARREGLRSLLIESGIHADETRGVAGDRLDESYGVWPDYRMDRLRW